MSLADLNHEQLDEDALRSALDDGEREGIRIEFKREVGTNDDAKAEWALDVTSFANTAGGVLLVGAEDSDMRLTGLPGIQGPVDSEMQRLESILRDRVDPTIPGLVMRPVDVDGRTVVAVWIPRSWRGPHLVRRGSRWQLARRNSSGKYVLQDTTEIRAAFAESQDAGERLRRWHHDRPTEIQAGQTSLPPPQAGFMVFSVAPLGAGVAGEPPVLDVAAAIRDHPADRLRPLYTGGDGPRVNVDGLMAIARGNQGEAVGYAQLYRNAALVYADTVLVGRPEQGAPGTVIVNELIDTLLTATSTVQWAGGSMPVVVQLSVHQAAGTQLHVKLRSAMRVPRFDRDHLELPSVIVDRQLQDHASSAVALRPLLDGLWNAAGLVACEHFDEEGNLAMRG